MLKSATYSILALNSIFEASPTLTGTSPDPPMSSAKASSLQRATSTTNSNATAVRDGYMIQQNNDGHNDDRGNTMAESGDSSASESEESSATTGSNSCSSTSEFQHSQVRDNNSTSTPALHVNICSYSMKTAQIQLLGQLVHQQPSAQRQQPFKATKEKFNTQQQQKTWGGQTNDPPW